MMNTHQYSPEMIATIDDPEMLRNIAADLGVSVHHKTGVEKLKTIIGAVVHNQVAGAAHEADKVKPAPIQAAFPTLDEIRAEAAKYAEKGMEIRFLDDDTNWNVRCKGAEDSGTVMQPLSEIKKRFTIVAQGARNPRIINSEGGKVLL